jgi:hypothetical protein
MDTGVRVYTYTWLYEKMWFLREQYYGGKSKNNNKNWGIVTNKRQKNTVQ